MEHAYAQALWKMIGSGIKPKEAVHALHEMLVRLGRVSLLPKIGRALVRIAMRDEGRSGVVLLIAREKDESRAKKEAKEFLFEMNLDPKGVTVHVDDTLIGGWRVEGRERLVDASFKKSLLDMYNAATTSISRT